MRRLLLALLLFSLPVPLLAAESTSIDCNAFELVPIADDNVYKDVYEQAKSVARDVCLSISRTLILDPSERQQGVDADLQHSLAEFAAFSAQALISDFGSSTTIKLNDNATEMKQQLASIDIATGKLPEFRTGPAEDEGFEGYFTTGDKPRFQYPENSPECTQVRGANKNCKALFDDFAAAFNAYRKAYDNVVTSTNKVLLNAINRGWDDFLDVSKSQTGLEVWLTTLWHSRHFKKDHIVGPPSSQIIALHPQLVYEYVDGAVDGDNAEFGVAVEWLGINFWNKKMPFGFSVASVYTDRVSIADIRTGVMLHLDNKYSIGWGYRDGENSVYFSLDLLTLFQSKRQQYDRYIQQYQSYLE